MPKPVVRDSAAWLLTLGGGLRAAVGERELVHLVEAPTLLDVPTCPYFCRSVLVWNGRLLPAMDVQAWLQGQSPASNDRKLAGVVAYQPAPHTEPDYGVLLLTAVPQRLRVTDAQACPLPEHPSGWSELALSCFLQDKNAIPILDLPQLFSGALLTQ